MDGRARLSNVWAPSGGIAAGADEGTQKPQKDSRSWTRQLTHNMQVLMQNSSVLASFDR